jgi:hypothetical protein
MRRMVMTIIWPETWEYVVICCLSIICLLQLAVLLLVFGAAKEIPNNVTEKNGRGDQEDQ